ncbi:MAG: GNAT family N-acetyltransferase [Ferruginibacter sp.]|nr:GNAT family N-acetyltransferase [Ferruginibacter sp.]
MAIHFIPYKQIDKLKWNACIDSADNGLIYGYSIYLDAMAKHWDALVLNDYEALMPLTWNKKFGIAYLYQPPFMQQLGIFGKGILNEDTKKLFVEKAQQRFRFAEIFGNFNDGVEQPNFILPLSQPYAFIKNGYKNDLRKNLKHAATFSISYQTTDDFAVAIELYKSQYVWRIPHVKELDYQQFSKLCATAKSTDNLLIRKVVDDKQNILAIALLFKDKKRLYNVLSVVTTEGRRCEANHYLFDKLIEEFSGRPMLLDFEGSSIDGIASFYQKFGAVNEPYFLLRYNHLPWPFKYFK